MEYDFDVVCNKGEKNTVANVLSCMLKDGEGMSETVATVLTISIDPKLGKDVGTGYRSDAFCQKVLNNLDVLPFGDPPV